MLKLELAALCEAASVDRSTNQVSLFKIIEGMNFPGSLPFIIPKIILVMFWDRDSSSASRIERATVRISLDPPRPQTEALARSDINIEVPSNKRRARIIYELAGVPVTTLGRNEIIIKRRTGSRWEEVGRVAFDVTNNPSPESSGSIPL